MYFINENQHNIMNESDNESGSNSESERVGAKIYGAFIAERRHLLRDADRGNIEANRPGGDNDRDRRGLLARRANNRRDNYPLQDRRHRRAGGAVRGRGNQRRGRVPGRTRGRRIRGSRGRGITRQQQRVNLRTHTTSGEPLPHGGNIVYFNEIDRLVHSGWAVPDEEVAAGERMSGQWWKITSWVSIIDFDAYSDDHGTCNLRENGRIYNFLYRKSGIAPGSLNWREANRSFTRTRQFRYTAANAEHENPLIDVYWVN